MGLVRTIAGKITIRQKVITILFISLLVCPLYFNLIHNLKLKDFIQPKVYPIRSQTVDILSTNQTPYDSQSQFCLIKQ